MPATDATVVLLEATTTISVTSTTTLASASLAPNENIDVAFTRDCWYRRAQLESFLETKSPCNPSIEWPSVLKRRTFSGKLSVNRRWGELGDCENIADGAALGSGEGSVVGTRDGVANDAKLGSGIGALVGTGAAIDVGTRDGTKVGVPEGSIVGAALGSGEGAGTGEIVGIDVERGDEIIGGGVGTGRGCTEGV